MASFSGCTTARPISTHALRMEGDRPFGRYHKRRVISTHALRMEGDGFFYAPGNRPGEFLPTPSAWRATAMDDRFFREVNISTHALRMEGDIDSRTPKNRGRRISTHALRMEGDLRLLRVYHTDVGHFYPRPPHGGRPTAISRPQPGADFYPRPPHGGRQQTC